MPAEALLPGTDAIGAGEVSFKCTARILVRYRTLDGFSYRKWFDDPEPAWAQFCEWLDLLKAQAAEIKRGRKVEPMRLEFDSLSGDFQVLMARLKARGGNPTVPSALITELHDIPFMAGDTVVDSVTGQKAVVLGSGIQQVASENSPA